MQIKDIEQAVLERQSTTAKKLIFKWLKTSSRSLENRIQACDWYRRLGLYKEAYLIIVPKVWNFSAASENPLIALQFLWVARTLTLLGDSKYSLSIVRQLKWSRPEDLRIVGNIYLSSYAYRESLLCFQKAWSRSSDIQKKTYVARLAVLGISDSLAGLKQYEKAYETAKSIAIGKDELLLKAIVTQAQGEYLAQSKKYIQAIKYLVKAKSYFPKLEDTVDLALEYKWLGYTYAHLEKRDEALKYFEKSLDILTRPDSRPEAWLSCQSHMNELGLLDVERQLILFAYPELPEFIYSRTNFPKGLTLYSSQAEITLMPDRNEWIENKKPRLGLSLTLKLLAYLRAAGTAGISTIRLKALLWPDDASSFFQLDGRIDQLLLRLKTEYDISTQTRNGVVRLLASSAAKVNVEVLHQKQVLSFYEKYKEFQSKEFAKYYSLGRTAAHVYLKGEVSRGVLIEINTTRRKVFRVCS